MVGSFAVRGVDSVPVMAVVGADGGDAISVAAGQVVALPVSILSGASLSAALDLGLGRLGRITLPAAWTAAALTFQVSPDGTNWFNLYDAAGTEYTVQAAASRAVIVPVADFLSVRYLKVRSGTGAVPVNQAADRALTLTLVA